MQRILKNLYKDRTICIEIVKIFTVKSHCVKKNYVSIHTLASGRSIGGIPNANNVMKLINFDHPAIMSENCREHDPE